MKTLLTTITLLATVITYAQGTHKYKPLLGNGYHYWTIANNVEIAVRLINSPNWIGSANCVYDTLIGGINYTKIIQ